jgi:hypothetical protein
MVFMIGRLIWQCVICWDNCVKSYIEGSGSNFDNYEMRKKLRQNMTKEKTRKFWREIWSNMSK